MLNHKTIKSVTTLIIAIGLIFASSVRSSAIDLLDEELHYVITYKWGLINKDAATAVLSLRNDGPYYQAKLAPQHCLGR